MRHHSLGVEATQLVERRVLKTTAITQRGSLTIRTPAIRLTATAGTMDQILTEVMTIRPRDQAVVARINLAGSDHQIGTDHHGAITVGAGVMEAHMATEIARTQTASLSAIDIF